MFIEITKKWKIMKECKKCNVVKDTTHFSKCKRNSDGLQYYCKHCNKIDNHVFRTQINPNHHAEWQRNNPQAFYEILRKHRKADKKPIIYSIKNPDGFFYIGRTEAFLTIRAAEHRRHFQRAEKGKAHPLPLLHDSFRKYGVENHEFRVVIELTGADKKELAFVETEFIKSFQELGKSLNVRTY